MASSQSNFVKTLRRLPLFTDLSDVELELIAENVSRLYFDEGTLIFEEGDVCRELLIVEEGAVKIVKSRVQPFCCDFRRRASDALACKIRRWP